MPYSVVDDAEDCAGWAVIKDETGEVMGCHTTKGEAEDQLTALNIAEYGDDRAADSHKPTAGMVEEAQRGLDWRREFGRGGTAVGIARARDIVNGRELPLDTVKRMRSFFARHEIDKQGQGFNPGEDGYPSNGRIAWALWGGDAGQTWANKIVEADNGRSTMVNEHRDIDGIYPVTARQRKLYEVFEDVTETFGKFDQGIGADGAHYVGPDNNPFIDEGMVCANCVLYEGPRACEIVDGDIDPNGICKMWVIPEQLLQITTAPDSPDMGDNIPMDEVINIEEEQAARSIVTDRDCVRSVPFEIRAAEDNADGLTLTGYAAVFNNSTMIDNWEGRFEERIRPGAFKRSINAKTPVLQFEHGRHPLLGSMPIGQITKLREDDHGLYVEARLADNWLIQPVRDAIASGAIDGMSFRFQVVRESWQDGDTPVRTLEEVKLMELGPVVFPAYEATTVGVRSADIAPLFDLPDVDRQVIARALILGTPLEPAPDSTSDGPADTCPDSLTHSGANPDQRAAQLRMIEGVL